MPDSNFCSCHITANEIDCGHAENCRMSSEKHSTDSACTPAPTNEQDVLVTIVTATYNLVKGGRTEYFRQCVESIHSQTYRNVEHLIIDGASTDGTLNLLKEYEQQGRMSILSEPDSGIYDAFNKAVRMAKGKYIAFLNSDDFWHNPRGIECSVHLLETSGATFSYAPCLWIDENGKNVSTQDTAISSFFWEPPCCHQTMFCRTDALHALGGFDTRYKIVGDYHATFRMLMQGERCVRVPLCFTSFRTGGVSCQAWNALLQECRSIHELYYNGALSANELDGLRERIIPPSLMSLFEQRLHPSVLTEMQSRCIWDEKRRTWRYCYAEFPRGLAALRWKMRNCTYALLRKVGLKKQG